MAAAVRKPWPFSGRASELKALAGLPGCEGRAIIVVAGRPGVGKSRLAEEYLRTVTAQGCPGAIAVARAETAGVPYGAVTHLLPTDVDPAHPVAAYTRAAQALRCSANHRRVVVVDDVQWLDTASAVLLRQLVDSGVVRVVATIGVGAPGSRASDALLSGGAVSRQDLSPFPAQTVEALLETVLGHHVGKGCIRRFFTLSGGNARYLRELVIGALDSGHLGLRHGAWSLADGPVPGTRWLTSAVEEQLSPAGPRGLDVMRRLAVSEPLSPTDLVRTVSPDTLEQLEAAGLVVGVQDGGHIHLRLAHPLHREMLRSGMPSRHRGEMLPQHPHGARFLARTTTDEEWVDRANDEAGADHGLRAAAVVLALTEAGRLPEARRIGQAAFEHTLDAGLRAPQLWLATLLGRLEWISGRVVDARRWFTEALACTGTDEELSAHRIALSGVAACYAAAGDTASAQRALTRLRERRDTRHGPLCAAEEALGPAWTSAAEGHRRAAEKTLMAAASAARHTGHLASEAMLLTEAARLGGAKNVLGRLDVNADRCDGRLAAARHAFVHALASGEPRALTASAAELRAMGAEALAAEAYTVASSSFHRRGQAREATSAANLAITARSSCQGVSTPLLGAAVPSRSLTAREREIALLAGCGKTTKEIAAHLFLSPRTVDNHLQRLYKKLGVSSRRELREVMHV